MSLVSRPGEEHPWTHHHRIAPPGLAGILTLFTWISAIDLLAYILSMRDAHDRHESRIDLAWWLIRNGVPRERAWAFVAGDGV